jgi:hypothetical protein|tara:strand:- start:203 stop:490 length:288 start_codon:yes stop_codon:yes gene_type:complete
MLKLVKKTVVDSNNTLWELEYDASDNTVEILSEYARDGSAFLSEYSLDNALGHGIPQAVLSSAEAMLDDDDYATQGNEFDVDAFNSMFESLQNPF